VINATRKVTKRERKVERAADTGTRETVRRAQVSVFSPEFRTESPLTDRQLSAYARDTRQKPSRSRQQSRLLSIDNSKKKRKERLKHGKVAGPGGKIAVLILVLLAIAICIFGYTTARKVFDDAAMDPNDLSKIEYTVYDGTTDDEVGEFLESHGMVESTLMYKLRAKIFDAEYVAGTYELSPSYSTEKIINILSGFDYSSGN